MHNFAGEELYWGSIQKAGAALIFSGDDINHITRVMRHKPGDRIFVTNGDGAIIETEITATGPASLEGRLVSQTVLPNRLQRVTIAVPRLKNLDKIELAIEKLVETGFTRFIFFNSDNAIGKGFKLDRWKKIAVSAAKQSFTPFTPHLTGCDKFAQLFTTGKEVIGFDLESEDDFANFTPLPEKEYILVTGPEGGLSTRELAMFSPGNLYRLTKNRLRSETACLYSAFRIGWFY